MRSAHRLGSREDTSVQNIGQRSLQCTDELRSEHENFKFRYSTEINAKEAYILSLRLNINVWVSFVDTVVKSQSRLNLYAGARDIDEKALTIKRQNRFESIVKNDKVSEGDDAQWCLWSSRGVL